MALSHRFLNQKCATGTINIDYSVRLSGFEDEDVDGVEDGEVFTPEGDGLEGVDVEGERRAGVEDGDMVWVVRYSVLIEGYYLKSQGGIFEERRSSGGSNEEKLAR